MKILTAEEAWLHISSSPRGAQLMKNCYYATDAAEAWHDYYESEEWQETRLLLNDLGATKGTALDLGAGNGIASYALSQSGYRVIALEPDPSMIIGHGAIKNARQHFDIEANIQICPGFGEQLPFSDETFDFVYARQVLHHAADLRQMLSEVYRVLKQGGCFLAVREHVVDSESDKEIFLTHHALHSFTGQESAYHVAQYRAIFRSCGFIIVRVLGPWDTVINHYPVSNNQVLSEMRNIYARKYGPLGRAVSLSRHMQRRFRLRKSDQDRTPGRMYSFYTVKH